MRYVEFQIGRKLKMGKLSKISGALCAATLLFAACTTAKNAADCGKSSEQASAKTVSVAVDCARETGKIKPLNGVNWGPQINTESAGIQMRKPFYDLNVHSVRTHDISLQNSGLLIGDTDMIFPLMHADASDPKSYIFKPTDDYLKIATKDGAKVVFRLGVSIDHSVNKYRTAMPDAKKWADICCHIIAHYNEGWANGYKMGIEYWEIWNEPECKNPDGSQTMWSGTMEEFTKFYVEAAKIIKSKYPNIKVGGPAFTYPHKIAQKFINDIAKEKAPLDFFTWHCYSKSVDELVNLAKKTRGWLDAAGYKSAENHINEWHYFPLSWKQLRAADSDKDRLYARINGVEAGVFACSAMTAWQDAPLDVSNYYYFGGSSGNWGMLKDDNAIFGSYYPFKAFGQIVKYKTRLKTDIISAPKAEKYATTALAGKDASGGVAAIVNLFDANADKLVIEFKNTKADISKAEILVCDETKQLEKADGAKAENGKITIPVKSQFTTVLIKLK